MIVNAIGNVVIPPSSEDNAVVYHLGWRKGFDHFKGQLLYTLLRPFPLEFPMLVRSIFLHPLGPTDNCWHILMPLPQIIGWIVLPAPH